MKPAPQSSWSRLVNAARLAADDASDASAPHGFATRVVARAFEERPAVSLFELFSWRALGVAGLLAFASVLANFSQLSTSVSSGSGYDDVMSGDDAVARLLDLS